MDIATLNPKKIGLLTWHYYGNVGSNLQAFAMQFIFSKNAETEFINYRPRYREPWYRNLIRLVCGAISDRCPHLLPEMFRFRAYQFQKQYINQSELINDAAKLTEFVRRYDAVICGSDQIWAPNVLKREYLLGFVPDEINKYSYAASIGLNNIPASLEGVYIQDLKRFKLIGVRETQGAQIISKMIPECSDKVVDVLDPTLLVPNYFWDDISIKPKIDNRYMFCYFLGESIWHREYVAKIAKEMGLKLIIYSSYKQDKSYADKHIMFMGPREFIGHIKEATHIMTDSFHGTIFSVIYKKQFSIFYRFENDDPICQNSRILNLISKFGLESSVVNDSLSRVEIIDYSIVDKNVEKEVIKSKEFVNRILLDIGGKNA